MAQRTTEYSTGPAVLSVERSASGSTFSHGYVTVAAFETDSLMALTALSVRSGFSPVILIWIS